MVSESVQRVLAFLDSMGAVEPITVVALTQKADGGFWKVTVADLVDLVHRAVLCDSLATEIDRQATEIHRLRLLLPDEPGIIDP